MVKFLHDKKDLLEAFGIKEQDSNFISQMMAYTEEKDSITRTIERIWIDENITDNVRCFAIFAIGRLYQMRKKGGENDN